MTYKPAHKTAIATAVLVAGIAGISHFEGTVYSPYQDIAGNWTVCRGHTGPDVIPGHRWTQAQCDAAFREDYGREAAVAQSCIVVPMTEGQQVAVFDFSYNVGGAAFCRSSMADYLNAGKPKEACAAFRKWVYVGRINCRTAGSKCPGIVKRRDWEYAKCMGGEA